jgi:hypothetical protein
MTNNEGALLPSQQTDFIISYDFNNTNLLSDIYYAQLRIDVTDSIITVPIKMDYKTNIIKNDFNELKIYPNPATNYVTVTIPIIKEPVELEIYSFTGQKIYSSQLNCKSRTFSISELGIKNAHYFETVKLMVEYRF